MKKIFLSVLAVAALASCTKMDTAYEAPQEIGFTAIAGNMTKAAVDGTIFPTTLNMFVYAETTDNTTTTANYINKAEFKQKSVVDSKNVWGGASTPYYWPNSHNLHFAGYSNSGNVSSITPSFSFGQSGSLSITNYSPGDHILYQDAQKNNGINDLMWFPTTEIMNSTGYDKTTKFVPVTMFHTCSWITFLVKGDAATTGYKITSIAIQGIDKTADVTCSATKTTIEGTDVLVPTITWENNTTQGPSEGGSYQAANVYGINIPSGFTLSTVATNIETGIFDNTSTTNKNESFEGGNVVLIPQLPGKIRIDWTQTGTELPDYGIADLSLDGSATKTTKWEPGKHYIYTITIKANEILVAPTPIDWTLSQYDNITVE